MGNEMLRVTKKSREETKSRRKLTTASAKAPNMAVVYY